MTEPAGKRRRIFNAVLNQLSYLASFTPPPRIYDVPDSILPRTGTPLTLHQARPVTPTGRAFFARGEGELASNGALCVDTGDRTGRSPSGVHGNIGWGKINRPTSSDKGALTN